LLRVLRWCPRKKPRKRSAIESGEKACWLFISSLARNEANSHLAMSDPVESQTAEEERKPK
jgi:hypothetical protein